MNWKNNKKRITEHNGLNGSSQECLVQLLLLCMSRYYICHLRMSLATDYLPVEVSKREGISKQMTKRGEHILMTKKKKNCKAICHSFPEYIICYKTRNWQNAIKSWFHRRCQISHGFQWDQGIFNLFICNLRNTCVKRAVQFLSELCILSQMCNIKHGMDSLDNVP